MLADHSHNMHITPTSVIDLKDFLKSSHPTSNVGTTASYPPSGSLL